MRERLLCAVIGLAIAGLSIVSAHDTLSSLVIGVAVGLVGWIIGGYIWRLRWLSTHDELTGLKNRRPFERTLRDEWDYAVKHEQPLSLLFMDVDDFGHVNKLYGHLLGDKVLRSICRHMRQTIRNVDCMARWGGEEFVVVLPGATLDQAVMVAERIRACVCESVVREGGAAVRVTISVGVSSAMPGTAGPEQLLRDAVMCQMNAKTHKNAIAVAAH